MMNSPIGIEALNDGIPRHGDKPAIAPPFDEISEENLIISLHINQIALSDYVY